MNSSYMNRFLIVDLSSGSVEIKDVPEKLAADFVGGKGFGAKILYDNVPAGVDPLGEKNLLMFMTGPLTGTVAPAMRGCVVTKSPLTGIFLDSYFGGSFAPEIKYAGYDGIVIKGKAASPSYIWIDDDRVEIRDASGVWGKDALEANHEIKRELNDETIKLATIGQAGENLVRFALICCEYNRQAGRGGAGAVMGSKNLKAVAVRGSKRVSVADPEGFRKAWGKAVAELKASADIKALTDAGTAASVDYASETGLLPHRNYRNGTFAKSSDLADKGQSKHLWLGSSACMGCPIRCSKMGAVRIGKYKGIVTDIVEYESAALMGSNLDISDVRAVAHLVKLCDRFGMDSMSTGTLIGFAMEASEKGMLRNFSLPEGVEIRFGNVAAAEYLLKAMANGSDELGVILSKGVRQAALEIDRMAALASGDIASSGSESAEPIELEHASDIAMHTKGLETPAWGPRGASGMALAIMTTDRGGCHQRGFPVSYEIGGLPWKGKTLDPLSPVDKADMVMTLQNYSAGTDTLVKCDFGTFGISADTYGELLEAAIGKKVETGFFHRVGERIWNLVRLLNLREGIDSSKDTLPRRFVKEPLPDGPSKGHMITEEDMAYMRSEYYRLRRWSENGIPLGETLQELGIDINGCGLNDLCV